MVNKKTAVAQLQALAAGIDGRSESSRLLDIISEVEAALAAGVKREIVLATLHAHFGFTMSMSGFEKALKRIRKKQGKPSFSNTQTASHALKQRETFPVKAENDQDEEEQDNIQTVVYPSHLRAIRAEAIDMAALSKLGKEVRKKKYENSRN